jgi:hypothetical protein
MQDRAMMRHGVIGKAEENAVEGFRRNIIDRIALGEVNIIPAVPTFKVIRLTQHPRRQVDTVDTPRLPHSIMQKGKISPRAAPNFKDAVTCSQLQTINRIPSQSRRKKKQPFKKWN